MTLKDQLYQTLHRNHKPLKLIAEEVGMSENYLYRSCLPDLDESDTGTGCRFPLNKLIPVIRSTADFAVLDFIEQSLGRVAFTTPVPNSNLADACRLTMIAVREFGHLMSEMEVAMSDGAICQKEKARIREEGYDAMQAIVNLLKCLENAGK